MQIKVLYKQLLDGALINKDYVANTLKQSAQCYRQSKYIGDGYQQQQLIFITHVSWVLPNFR